MSKSHIALISGLLALAAVVGTVAATRTVSLGSANRQSANATVAARIKQLDRLQASLQRALAKKPAALPATAPSAPRVVYHRPPPIVVVKHVHHGDDGSFENADGGDGGDG